MAKFVINTGATHEDRVNARGFEHLLSWSIDSDFAGKLREATSWASWTQTVDSIRLPAHDF